MTDDTHVTVARRASMTEETLTDGLVWRVDEFRLMRSERHADGASYSTVKAWRLGAAGVGGTP
ncbi:hypothetical protein H0Z60_10445 [Ectothiorhodospiraceae bacterium WFHF3C12]|nr:hypothetical protein [Ectothiorhodospiraceae bacterium WFHF3C12]